MEIIQQVAAVQAQTKPDTIGTDTNLIGDVTAIINAVIGVLGLVCVVVMIIGGINYMTSSGDAAKVKKGKDTILYGLIGLVVCVLAFALVNWVILGLLGSQGSNSSSPVEKPSQSQTVPPLNPGESQNMDQ